MNETNNYDDDVDYGDFYYEEANRAADEMGEDIIVPLTEDHVIPPTEDPQEQTSAPEEEMMGEGLDPEVEQRARELAAAYMTDASRHQIVKLGNIHVEILETRTTEAVRSVR